jgi:hypothetical protein
MSIATREIFSQYRRGSGAVAIAFFLENIVKLHEFAQNFGTCKYNTLRLDESHRSATAVKFKTFFE